MSSPRIRWVSFKSYSGFLASGGRSFDSPVSARKHVDRAVFQAGQLESGSWGTVQGYDGCAVSGGVLHNIAVSPKDLSQGTFFELLRDVFAAAPAESSEVVSALSAVNWEVTQDGKLRSKETGALVKGKDIRNEISGSPDGKVSKTGPDADRARRWIELFFHLFDNSATSQAQSDYAAKWLASGNRGDELRVYNHFLKRNLDSIIGINAEDLPREVELAMCVYHNFSVNAPGIAKAVLTPVLDRMETLSPEAFARTLIRGLGKKQYGNWLDDPGDGSNRYDKTRKLVWRRSDLWDTAMAKSIMPRDL